MPKSSFGGHDQNRTGAVAVLQTAVFPLHHVAMMVFYHEELANAECQALLAIFHMLHSVTMKAIKVTIISLIALSTLGIAIFIVLNYYKEKPAGILINTSPVSDVYINGNLVGKTPYSNTYKAGEIYLKIVPNSSSQKLITYETRITLISGIETVVRREFGESEDKSSGDTISFNRIGRSETGIIVISTPENAQVSVDGLPQGFAPYKTSSISPVEHQITIKAPGYTDRIMTLKTLMGYRLSLYAKLAKASAPQPVASPAPIERTYVQILSTPTGFLRVRSGPGAAGSEIALVKPGDQYLFLDEDVATGWIKIQYEAPKAGLPNGIEGWVSGQYVKKITVTEEASRSATIK